MSQLAITPDAITSSLVGGLLERLQNNEPVSEDLPGGGKLHIERQHPFLCVSRVCPGLACGADLLIDNEASYFIAPADPAYHPGSRRLINAIVQNLSAAFGAFLVVEVWEKPLRAPIPGEDDRIVPQFRMIAPQWDELSETLSTFREALSWIRMDGQPAQVELELRGRLAPPGASTLLPTEQAKSLNCHCLGVEFAPVYRAPDSEQIYPMILRTLRREFSHALRRTIHKFLCSNTTQCPIHFHVLGKQAIVDAVWEVDEHLDEVAKSFDFLLQVTPVNGEYAWQEFRRQKFQRTPTFLYRPLPADPVVLKRRLFATPIEQVEDPALSQLFREKQLELDRQIGLLQEVNTPNFVHGSIPLFGVENDELLPMAKRLLEELPARARDDSKGGYLTAHEFASLAEEEFAYYRKQWPEFNAQVQVRSDIVSGLMVSHGSLLVSSNCQVPRERAMALLQHEVGTHVLTYHNGRSQPFRQLATGLAGYETLQEGIAVLAEYLVGGLSRPRLRLLAARVVASNMMRQGADFVETFRVLVEEYEFTQRTAFTVTMRIYRGGGLTKDAVYLRGLCEVLEYLASGGRIEPLLVGKISLPHIPIVRELQFRNVLRQPPLQPRYLSDPAARERLEKLRSGLTVFDLISGV